MTYKMYFNALHNNLLNKAGLKSPPSEPKASLPTYSHDRKQTTTGIGQPIKPIQPAKPARPARPAAPAKPAKPAKPATPARPK